MNPRLISRWLLFLPAAIAAGLGAAMICGVVLGPISRALFEALVGPVGSKGWLRLSLPLFAIPGSFFFVWAGSAVAPARKIWIATILLIVALTAVGSFFGLTRLNYEFRPTPSLWDPVWSPFAGTLVGGLAAIAFQRRHPV